VPNPQISPQTTFISFVIEVSLNDVKGKLTLGYSGPLIKSLLKKIKEQHKPKPLQIRKFNKEMLSKIYLPVVAVLGKTELSASEIKQLEGGDVVSLDNSIRNAVTLIIGNEVNIPVQPSTINGKTVIRIVGSDMGREVPVAPPLYEEELTEEEESPKEEGYLPSTNASETTLPIPEQQEFGEDLLDENNEFKDALKEEELEDEEFEDFPEDKYTDEEFKDEFKNEFPEDTLKDNPL